MLLPMETNPEFPVFQVDLSEGWRSLLAGPFRQPLETRLLPKFIQRQRWFGGKAEAIEHTEILDWFAIPDDTNMSNILLVMVNADLYAVFLSIAAGADRILKDELECALARLSTNAHDNLVLFDGLASSDSCLALLRLIKTGQHLPGATGAVQGIRTSACQELEGPDDELLSVRRNRAEQSNSSVLYGDRFILKLFRHLHRGRNPDYEIGSYLTEQTDFRHSPRVAGAIEFKSSSSDHVITLAVLHEFVVNQGDAWTYTIDELQRFFKRASERMDLLENLSKRQLSIAAMVDQDVPEELQTLLGDYARESRILGTRTCELHLELARPTEDPAFRSGVLSKPELRDMSRNMHDEVARLLRNLSDKLETLPEGLHAHVRQLCALRREMISIVDSLPNTNTDIPKMRCHGDYHLGQVLRVSGDFVIIDFEGEPAKPLVERVKQQTPITDIAGMLRSFSYATFASLLLFARNSIEDLQRFLPWARICQSWVMVAFLKAYLAAAEGSAILPADRSDFFQVLHALMLEKALYELDYELNSRPDWLIIPLYSILDYLQQ